MSKISNIINKKKKDKLRILTFPTHERYETNLCKTGHDFYSLPVDKMKEWEGKTPNNYHILNKNKLYPSSGYDLILAQSRFGQMQLAHRLNSILKLPIICLEHTVPTPDQSEQQRHQMGQLQGDINVFISNYSKLAWGHYGVKINSTTINHCVDTEIFKPLEIPEQSGVLTVANDFKKRNYCLNYSGWERITAGLPSKLIGKNNEGFNSIEDPKQLAQEYNKCAVYLNTTTHSTIPMSLLEAMSCGCAVVSTATCAIPDVIKHGYNGFISNDEQELKKFIKNLLDNEDLRKEMEQNARKTILENFNEKSFISNWNHIFNQTYETFT